MKPLVSVVVSTYNRPYELCELLESLSVQTFRDFEVILVNDAGQPIHFVSTLYPELQIHIIDHHTNRQLVHAKNAGIMRANGTYILLCDDDDMLLPMHVEKMLENIHGFDLVYSDAEIFNFQWHQNVRVPTEWSLFAYDTDYMAMRKFSTFLSTGALYRKSIHDEIGLFDPYVQPYWDWDFYLRLAQHHQVGKVPIASALYAFATEGSNMSGQLDESRMYLDRLSQKHQLGPLPTSNFKLLLQEPEMQARQTPSLRLWDGQSVQSRLLHHPHLLADA